MRALVLTTLLLATPALAESGPEETILSEAAAACASFENGTFDAQDAVTRVDLDGDGAEDTVIDESRFACSSAASLYCGSGGCMLHTIVGGAVDSVQATGWRLIAWDDEVPILLIGRDGGWCGGAGAQVCFEAVNWSMGQRMTVMPPAPEN